MSNVLVDQNFTSSETDMEVLFYEDASHKFTIKDIQALSEEHWSKTSAKKINFGFSESVYWVKLNVRNISSQESELILHANYALLDQIEFFQLQNKQLYHHYKTGDSQPFSERAIPYPTFLFPFTIPQGQEHELYLRLESEGTLQAPLRIWEQAYFYVDSQNFLFLYGCFISAMLIMSAYNLCLFFMIREKTYLIYSVFIVLATGVHTSLDGFAYQWFWPNAISWHQISAIFFIATGCFVTTVFTQALLPIPKKSRIQIGIHFLMILTACSALMSLLLSYRHAAMLNATTTVISMTGVILVCLFMLRHSPVLARYFIAAWSVYFFGIILKSTSNVGLIESSFLSEYAGNIGAVVAILIMSLALAERIKAERQAKEQAQQDSITHLKRFESLYENALEGVFTFNVNGQLLSANPSFYRLTGIRSMAEFNQQKADKNKFRLTPERFERLLAHLRTDGKIKDYETKITSLAGDANWLSVSARLSFDEASQSEVVEGTLININERKQAEEQLRHYANHDPLTGLVNRRVFEQAIAEALSNVKEKKHAYCLLYLDLDQFKIVNDLCGHSAGDVLLKNLSQRLFRHLDSLNKRHIIARLGGDEFGILLNKASLSQAQLISEELRQSIEEFLFVWDGQRFSLGVSIGLVELLPFHHSVEQIVAMADTACYLAKDQGRNRVHTFVESDQELEFRQLEMQWVSDIKQALKEDGFFLVFQDIVPNKIDEPGYHYEILLRLISKQGNLCAPVQFLPPAERYSLMPNIDRWVIDHYFSWLHTHPDHLDQLACASINLSTKSIGDPSFSVFLKQAFSKYRIPYQKVCFEITESMAITHIDNTHVFIDTFHRLGCRFALDDFGTGFSSYAYLKDLQVDYLKIDGVFIKNLTEDPVSLAMVKSIADVASAIGIKTIAEFVETETIKQTLTDLGITYSQGYHIHKPVKLDIERFNETFTFNSRSKQDDSPK